MTITRLRRPTELHRFSADQQGCVAIDADYRGEAPVVGAEGGDEQSPAGVRQVTLLLPASPLVMAAIDETPTEAGPNRTGYKWAPLPPDTFVRLHLQPDQRLYVCAVQGGGSVVGAVIIEYPAEGA